MNQLQPEQAQCHEQFPFLTCGVSHGVEYVGIIIVSGKNYTSMYSFNHIKDPEMKRDLIDLGNQWWWQSNRNIPINIFIPEKMEDYEFCKVRFATKDFEHIFGPKVQLSQLPTKRIKRCTTALRVG